MKKYRLSVTCFLLVTLFNTSHEVLGQQTPLGQHYGITVQKDLPFFLVSTGTFIAGRFAARNVNNSTLEQISALNPEDIWGFDRPATVNYSITVQTLSDIMLYSSLALPLSCYISANVSNEGWGVALMLMESVFLTDGISNIIKGSVKRYRPLTYNSRFPLEDRLSKQSRLSFVSGHTSITAAMSFLSAKILVDLYPDSPYNPLIWSVAAIFPGLTGFFRFRAGKHFPTDIIGGYVLGAGVGLVLPELHHNKHVRIIPTANGFGLVWTF